jgi:hypothetical protein
MNFRTHRNFLAVLVAATLSTMTNASSCDGHSEVVGKAFLRNSSIELHVTNATDSNMEVRRGFAHEQNIYIVILLKKEFGEVIERSRTFGGDPPVGSYRLGSHETAVEMAYLPTRWPRLMELDGPAIIFWSADVALRRGAIDCSIRVSGSLQVDLPLTSSSIEVESK